MLGASWDERWGPRETGSRDRVQGSRGTRTWTPSRGRVGLERKESMAWVNASLPAELFLVRVESLPERTLVKQHRRKLDKAAEQGCSYCSRSGGLVE